MHIKKITTSLFFLFFSLTIYAGTPADTTATDTTAIDTTTTPAQPAVTPPPRQQTTAPAQAGTDEDIVAGLQKKVVDSSLLYNAVHYPKEFLYSSYLFNTNYKAKIQWFYAISAVILLLILWVGGLKYAKKEGLCKDACFDKEGNPLPAELCPYSYSRCQLFFWTLVILTCYTFFYGATGVLLPLNATAAVLLGFGAMVYGFGKVIDSRQIQQSKGERNQDLGAQNTKPDFIKDILSDDNGVSIHRFQAALFNLIFGVGFIAFFIKAMMNYKYPLADFNEWQFALLGISSTTYLGLKATENDPDNIKDTKAEAGGDGGEDIEPDGSVG